MRLSEVQGRSGHFKWRIFRPCSVRSDRQNDNFLSSNYNEVQLGTRWLPVYYCAVQERLQYGNGMFHSFPAGSIMHRLHSRRMNPPEMATRVKWWTAGLTAATSGADGKRRRVFKKARSSGPRGSFTSTVKVILGVLIWSVCWLRPLLCIALYVQLCRDSQRFLLRTNKLIGWTNRVCSVFNRLLSSSGNPPATGLYSITCPAHWFLSSNKIGSAIE